MALRDARRRWLTLGLGLGGLAALVAALDAVSPRLPGTAGSLYRRNVAEDIETTAFIYTESGNVSDYLDEEHGRYARDLPRPDRRDGERIRP
jgi:hypothetical protein